MQVDGLVVTRPAADVSEGDVDAMVENLRAQRPKFVTIERESREGDRITMNFTGHIDGKAFEGSKGDNVSVLLGNGAGSFGGANNFTVGAGPNELVVGDVTGV